MEAGKRPFTNTSAFKRIVLDIKTEDAMRYDEAMQKAGVTGARSAHIRALILAFTETTLKGKKRNG